MKRMRIFVLVDLWRRAKEKMQAVARRAATEERAKMLVWSNMGRLPSFGSLWMDIGQAMASDENWV